MMRDQFQNIDRNQLFSIATGIVGAYLLIPNYFETNNIGLDYNSFSFGSLDPSWHLALNYAKLKDLNWGKEIAFTYGPLGYLCTRNGWGANRAGFLLFDFFIFANYFCVFYFAYKKSVSKLFALSVILLVILCHPFWITASRALIMLAFLVFWIRLSIQQPKYYQYCFQITLIVLLFFIKFNTGLITVPLFLSGLIYNWLSKKQTGLLTGVYFSLPIIMVVILSSFLKVDLWPYTTTGLQLISGYNEVMYLENTDFAIQRYALFFLLFVLIAIVTSRWGRLRQDWLKSIVIVFISGVSFFVLYKQGFVRADTGHILEFFYFSPLFFICCPDTHVFGNRISRTLLFLGMLIPVYCLFGYKSLEIDLKNKLVKTDYITRCINFTPESGMFLFKDHISLPQDVLEAIGTATVDVYPWNIQMLIENRLNYLPRPVIQSYTAYSQQLEEINFQHYNNSSSSPEFILYQLLSIDSRYAFFDEPKLNLAILKNYHPEHIFEMAGAKMILFKKNKDFRPIRFVESSEYAIVTGSSISPKEGVFYEIKPYYTISGKLMSVVKHAPEMKLKVKVQDMGSGNEFRTSQGLLESGAFSNVFFEKTEDIYDYFQKDSFPKIISHYSFIPEEKSYFQDKLRVTEFKIEQ